MSRATASLVIAMLLAAFSLLPPPARAQQLRAWLDRDRIALGETATLNIQSNRGVVDPPDYSPLLRDFRLSGNTSSRSFERVNGVSRTRTLFAVALQPRRDGVIGIPSLLVSGQRTQPLTITVTPQAAAPAQAGGVVFIEAETDAQQPYLQQAVGYTLRLYSAIALISGQLDQAMPDGASLQRIGDDVQYSREISGRRYNVIERHYLLIPERSGTLKLPGAQFSGRGVGGFFDDFFGDGQRELRASGPSQQLQVRQIPDQAPQPWLPLRALNLRYLATPQRARAGEAVSVTLEVTADGATAAQLPELQLPAIAGAQVFPDPPQTDERFDDARPQVRVTRKFSVVPAQAGSLRLRGPRMDWWDVRSGTGRTASLPDIDLKVAVGANGFGTASATAIAAASGDVPTDDNRGGIRVPGVQGPVQPWAFAAAVFALLWLVTLMWALHRHPQLASHADGPVPQSAPPTRVTVVRLLRALDSGGLDEVAEALCAMALPAADDCDEVHERLEDPAQRTAVAMLQRARWGGGDGVAARAALRDAFKRGPRWRRATPPSESSLPPLYPPA